MSLRSVPPRWLGAFVCLEVKNVHIVTGITKSEAQRVWDLMVADELLWMELLMLEPRLSRTLDTAKERLYVAELFSNLVQALTQKGW